MSQRPTHGAVEAIVDAVAAREGIDPVDVEPPLADVVDPAALERLLSSTANGSLRDVSVQFTYRGHDIVVDSAGDVEIS